MKNDTPEHWDTASQNGFIPLLGEPIFYRDENDTIYGVKLGDGKSTPNELPFLHGLTTQDGKTVLTNDSLELMFSEGEIKYVTTSEFSNEGAGYEYISLWDLDT
jgi:hypothetical protein